MTEQDESALVPPHAPFLSASPTGSESVPSSPSPNNSAPLLPLSKETADEEDGINQPQKRRSPLFWILIGAAAIIIIVLVVILPVYFTVIKPKNHNQVESSSGSSGSGGSSSGDSGDGNSGNGSNSSTPTTSTLSTGGDGSTVTLEDGSTFTYSNKFGGFWVSDPNNPFNNDAQPNSWTPALNTSWSYGTNKIYGVNLGGWLVLEPFISPALFQSYPDAVDEWTLSQLMAADTANGGLSQIEDHYKTFVTEKDIAEIAGAGLNWVRVALGFWAIEVYPEEPFLAQVSWNYFVRLIGWCRKYGIRINLDLHAVPGSANGYNHGGKLGSLNFLNGVMGVANAQRTLNYIRIITEFISQPEYRDVVVMFSVLNEAQLNDLGRDQLSAFYLEVHDMMRNITGIGQGPFMAIGDGFDGESNWAGFLEGSDRIALDAHPYFAFSGHSNTQPIDTGTGSDAGGIWPAQACRTWGPTIKTSQTGFGFTFAGEYSNGFNDCGLFLRGVGGSPLTTNCDLFADYRTWDASMKAGLLAFAEASMDALDNFFFWTWKIGNSTSGFVEAPLWSYQLGFENGWMPTDPRTASGKCQDIGVDFTPFSGSYQPWQIGGTGAGNIDQAERDEFGQFPPATISGVNVDASALPTYTPTGTIIKLPGPTLTPAPTPPVDVGDGWFDDQDTAGLFTPVAGCTYPDPWSAENVPVPTQC